MTIPPLPPLPGEVPKPPVRLTKHGKPMPPRAGMGRPPGVPNKTNQALKEAILLAAAEVGEDGKGKEGLMGYLKRIAIAEPVSFCSLLGKVLPLTIKGDGEGGGIVVEIVKRVYAAE